MVQGHHVLAVEVEAGWVGPKLVVRAVVVYVRAADIRYLILWVNHAVKMYAQNVGHE